MARNAKKELDAIMWKVNMEQQLMGLKTSAEIGEKLEQLFNEHKEKMIEKACKAYCKICDTRECEDFETDTCDWLKKFRKEMDKE